MVKEVEVEGFVPGLTAKVRREQHIKEASAGCNGGWMCTYVNT